MASSQTIRMCAVCKKKKRANEVMPLALVRNSVVELISNRHPEVTVHDFICFDDLNEARADYVKRALHKERGEISDLEQKVLHNLKEHEIFTENVNAMFDKKVTVAQRLADMIAEFGGSWKFIILFAVILSIWIIYNQETQKPFDPYPFILLNLLLSCIAALQAPVIMMSQNRMEEKDRMRAEYDFKTNLRAEFEVRSMNLKIDQLLTHQWQRLLEIQEIQLEVLNELQKNKVTEKSKPS